MAESTDVFSTAPCQTDKDSYKRTTSRQNLTKDDLTTSTLTCSTSNTSLFRRNWMYNNKFIASKQIRHWRETDARKFQYAMRKKLNQMDKVNE